MLFSTRYYRYLYLLICFGAYVQAKQTQLDLQGPIEFVIVIPSYNNERFAIENLESACFQKSSHPYEVIYVNDCSTDKTREVVENYIKENGFESFVKVINNEQNVGRLANDYNTIHSLVPDHKIVVLLDGDDKLAHDGVLTILERYYTNSDVWMTHGSRITFPQEDKNHVSSEPYPEDVILNNAFRRSEWLKGSHVITFRASLYKKIRKEDLLFEGEFIKVTGDLAFLFPMFEMCSPYKGTGKSHIQFIPEILYHYRINNPISDHIIRSREQKEMDGFIRTLKPYDALESL